MDIVDLVLNLTYGPRRWELVRPVPSTDLIQFRSYQEVEPGAIHGDAATADTLGKMSKRGLIFTCS